LSFQSFYPAVDHHGLKQSRRSQAAGSQESEFCFGNELRNEGSHMGPKSNGESPSSALDSLYTFRAS